MLSLFEKKSKKASENTLSQQGTGNEVIKAFSQQTTDVLENDISQKVALVTKSSRMEKLSTKSSLNLEQQETDSRKSLPIKNEVIKDKEETEEVDYPISFRSRPDSLRLSLTKEAREGVESTFLNNENKENQMDLETSDVSEHVKRSEKRIYPIDLLDSHRFSSKSSITPSQNRLKNSSLNMDANSQKALRNENSHNLSQTNQPKTYKDSCELAEERTDKAQYFEDIPRSLISRSNNQIDPFYNVLNTRHQNMEKESLKVSNLATRENNDKTSIKISDSTDLKQEHKGNFEQKEHSLKNRDLNIELPIKEECIAKTAMIEQGTDLGDKPIQKNEHMDEETPVQSKNQFESKFFVSSRKPNFSAEKESEVKEHSKVDEFKRVKMEDLITSFEDKAASLKIKETLEDELIDEMSKFFECDSDEDERLEGSIKHDQEVSLKEDDEDRVGVQTRSEMSLPDEKPTTEIIAEQQEEPFDSVIKIDLNNMFKVYEQYARKKV